MLPGGCGRTPWGYVDWNLNFVCSTSYWLVVPLEGTWIEIEWGLQGIYYGRVVPLEGTWIEIVMQAPTGCSDASYPLRVRGLKSLDVSKSCIVIARSYPLRVRGLKYFWRCDTVRIVLSYPLRVRGLKLMYLCSLRLAERSYPLRVRGLKSKSRRRSYRGRSVVPLEGTWIEIGGRWVR